MSNICNETFTTIGDAIRQGLFNGLNLLGHEMDQLAMAMRSIVTPHIPDLRLVLGVDTTVQKLNGRVYWLAYHHPKDRVRKKNLRRIHECEERRL